MLLRTERERCMCSAKQQLSKIAILFCILCAVCGHVYADVMSEAAEAGKIEYARSCENCHGASGKGDGPYSSRLIIKPADLTVLAKTNNGAIPIASIYRMIDGSDDVAFHGGSRMPIWGMRYQAESIFELGPDNSQTFVRGRIFELLIYLETLQVQ